MNSKFKTNIFWVILFMPAVLQSCSTGNANTHKERPNVILVLVDDMGFSDIGCYGSEISTPNIDTLGMNGLRFTQFYNASRCCPSRASLLTGLYPHQAGMGGMASPKRRAPGPYQGWLSRNAVTIAEVLQKSGYSTYMSGKWHLSEDSLDWPINRGFDKYFGLISGANSYFEILPNRTMAYQNTVCTSLPSDFYMTDATTDSALSFIKQGAPSAKPFFLYLAYTAPHWPLHAIKEKIEKHRGNYLVGWDSVRQKRYDNQMAMGLFSNPVDLSPRDEDVPFWTEVQDKKEWDLKMAVYAAMMESLDDGIGKITDYLTQTNQLDNTLIIFMSDNGASHEVVEGRRLKDLQDMASAAETAPTGEKGSYTAYAKEWANVSNTPFRLYKHWNHEGGISTPMIVHYPKVIKKGKITHEVSHLIDIMPTILDFTGCSYPSRYNEYDIQPQEGTSLASIMYNAKWKGHDNLFWEHEGSRAVRQGKWKLVSVPHGEWELYDMDMDRSELKNLADKYSKRVSAMAKSYESWAAKVGVK